MASTDAQSISLIDRPKILWRRSASLWSDSKDRCHHRTLEKWHRSSDSLSRSKSRCQRSTLDILSRSANKWHQSAKRLPLLPGLCEIGLEIVMRKTHASHSCEDLHASQPPPSPKSTTHPTSSSPHPIDTVDEQGSEEEQIRDILNLTDQVVYQASQAKHLRKSKSNLLGEIELSWIDSTIAEASEAARHLAKRVEPYRLEILKRKGKLRSSHRKSWRLVDYHSACERLAELTLHQKRLEKAMEHLQNAPNPTQNSDDNFKLEAAAELSDAAQVTTTTFELPCDPVRASPQSETTLVDLSGSPVVEARLPSWSIPKIIVTQAPDGVFFDHHSEETDEEFRADESNELDEVLQWDQTRHEIRLRQSESLSNIVAKNGKYQGGE